MDEVRRVRWPRIRSNKLRNAATRCIARSCPAHDALGGGVLLDRLNTFPETRSRVCVCVAGRSFLQQNVPALHCQFLFAAGPQMSVQNIHVLQIPASIIGHWLKVRNRLTEIFIGPRNYGHSAYLMVKRHQLMFPSVTWKFRRSLLWLRPR